MTCAECSTSTATVYLEMAPGRDGQRWHLCSKCWSAGVRALVRPTLKGVRR